MRLSMMTNSLFVIPGEPRPARRGKGTRELGQYLKASVILTIVPASPPGSPSLDRARYARVLAGDDSFGVYGTVC
jgi:hypothetical protein